MTSFRFPAATAVTALLALLGSVALAGQGGLWILVPLVPLAAMIWAWRAGTDVNEYGLRVRALLGRRIIEWSEVSALIPAPRGGVTAALTSGARLRLTAVRTTDLPALLAAAGKSPADHRPATPQELLSSEVR